MYFGKVPYQYILLGREGALSFLLTRFLNRLLNNFTNDFLNFDWLLLLFECPNVSTTKEVILCILIGDVHQFIGHCVITLDP